MVRFSKYLVSDPLERCSERVLDKLDRDLGALWGCKPKQRVFRDNGGECDNTDSDEEKKEGWIVISSNYSTNGIYDEAKGGNNDDMLECVKSTPEQNEEDNSASVTDEKPSEEKKDHMRPNTLSLKK